MNTCLNCDTPLLEGRKFCGLSCSATYSNKRRKKKTYGECPVCGKPRARRRNRFCSNKCQKILEHREYITRWLAGLEDGKLGEYQTSRQIKRYMIKEFGHQCVICKNTVWMGKPIPLILDHIDGNGFDNSPQNLRLICANCDRQTPTFGSRNRGKGRKERSKYEIRGNPQVTGSTPALGSSFRPGSPDSIIAHVSSG